MRNIYACLVHEAPDCIVDLVMNLQHNDPSSLVMLYNGGRAADLARRHRFRRSSVVWHPKPIPVYWGHLHRFAFDCMDFAVKNFSFDFLTIVDSDQLSVRPGYSDYLAPYMAARPAVGMLGTCDRPKPRDCTGPARAAWKEIGLWRQFLRRFPDGEAKFPHWTFWPATVFSASAARALVERFSNDKQLALIMKQSSLWATEEVIFPTLTALLGFEISVNPCTNDYVRYRVHCTETELARAFATPNIFWIHPVRRVHDDDVRSAIRARCEDYARAKLSAGS